MIRCFADTAYFLALVNPADEAHPVAVRLTRESSAPIVTTSAVLNELGNHLCAPSNRPLFIETIERLKRSPMAQTVHVDSHLFADAVEFFRAPADKEWSLTDCLSFLVREKLDIDQALTTDHHFEQAGFTILLR
jgi:predicted nucleic acid-binding protein